MQKDKVIIGLLNKASNFKLFGIFSPGILFELSDIIINLLLNSKKEITIKIIKK